MKTMREDVPVSLLLFDEPSAALDPEAEYGKINGEISTI
jgi:hypothetical protein